MEVWPDLRGLTMRSTLWKKRLKNQFHTFYNLIKEFK